jgi:hypothetical protein
MTALSRRRPGLFLQKGLKETARLLATGAGGDEDWSTQKMQVWFRQIFLVKHPPLVLGARNQGELSTLCKCIDLLVKGDLGQVGDVLMQRLRAIEEFVETKTWTLGRHLELITPLDGTLTTEAERSIAVRAELRSAKLREALESARARAAG